MSSAFNQGCLWRKWEVCHATTWSRWLTNLQGRETGGNNAKQVEFKVTYWATLDWPLWQQKSQRRVEVSQWKLNLDGPFGTCSGEHAVSRGRAECEASKDGAFYCFHQHLQRLLSQPSSLLCITTRLSLGSISIPWVEEHKSELRAIVSLTQNVCTPKMSLQVLYVTCHITCDSW